MKKARLNLNKRSYDIIVGKNILKFLGGSLARLKIGSDAYIITNKSVKDKYAKAIYCELKHSGFGVEFNLVADSEKSKSITTASSVIQNMARYDKKKRIFIIALGGGVIGDLAGFIASIYKRGIPYIQIPTTLLAQVDSSIGGKTAIDLVQGKNLIGAFYQPRLVFSDVSLLKTLPLKQLRSGLAEIIKYGIIKDPFLFKYLEKKYRDILGLKEAALEFVVWRCSLIKARIVQQDEKEEKGIRTILNFGHTIGHAIEAASGYKKYTHGEAIGLGMLVACQISKNLGMINTDVFCSIEDSADHIIEAHYRDKKFIGTKNRFVLTRGIGHTVVSENIPLKIIRGAVKDRIR